MFWNESGWMIQPMLFLQYVSITLYALRNNVTTQYWPKVRSDFKNYTKFEIRYFNFNIEIYVNNKYYFRLYITSVRVFGGGANPNQVEENQSKIYINKLFNSYY